LAILAKKNGKKSANSRKNVNNKKNKQNYWDEIFEKIYITLNELNK
jgi:hypothetical protein